MTDSVRELILQSIATQVSAITTANGYDINVANVERARRVFVDNELPAIGIFDGGEESVSQYNVETKTMNIAVDLHSDALTENRSIHANKMLASLKKAVLSADTSHSGKAERTSITAASINYPQDDDETTMTVSVTVTVVYEEVTGDPYTTP